MPERFGASASRKRVESHRGIGRSSAGRNSSRRQSSPVVASRAVYHDSHSIDEATWPMANSGHSSSLHRLQSHQIETDSRSWQMSDLQRNWLTRACAGRTMQLLRRHRRMPTLPRRVYSRLAAGIISGPIGDEAAPACVTGLATVQAVLFSLLLISDCIKELVNRSQFVREPCLIGGCRVWIKGQFPGGRPITGWVDSATIVQELGA